MKSFLLSASLCLSFVYAEHEPVKKPYQSSLEPLLKKKTGILYKTFLEEYPRSTGERRKEIRKLITQLGNDSYKLREAATQKLKSLGAAAIGDLFDAKRHFDPEVRRSAEGLVKDFLREKQVDATDKDLILGVNRLVKQQREAEALGKNLWSYFSNEQQKQLTHLGKKLAGHELLIGEITPQTPDIKKVTNILLAAFKNKPWNLAKEGTGIRVTSKKDDSVSFLIAPRPWKGGKGRTVDWRGIRLAIVPKHGKLTLEKVLKAKGWKTPLYRTRYHGRPIKKLYEGRTPLSTSVSVTKDNVTKGLWDGYHFISEDEKSSSIYTKILKKLNAIP